MKLDKNLTITTATRTTGKGNVFFCELKC